MAYLYDGKKMLRGLFHILKVHDQIILENKFCLNFKIRSVFIPHPKLKTIDLYLVLK